MAPVFAWFSIILAAHHHGRHRFGRDSYLTSYARALKITPAKLWALVIATDRRRFAARHLAVDPRCRDTDAVADRIVKEWAFEEICWRWIEALDREGSLRPGGPCPLSKVRPLRPESC
jgi:hypothetical protein